MSTTGTIEEFQLSPLQKRAWRLMAECGPGHPLRSQVAVAVGEMDPERLTDAVERVARAQEILRTAFRVPPGRTLPVQEIVPALDVRGALVEDAGGVDTLDRRFGRLLERPFRLDAPPLQIDLFTAPEMGRVVLLGLPALSGDACTLELLARSVAEACAGREPAEPAYQYADIGGWLAGFLDEPDEEARAWWAEHCAPSPRLPFERAAAGPAPFAPAAHPLSVPPEIADGIAARAREAGVDPEAFLLAAWSTLLWRYARAPLAVGVECDGRAYEGLGGVMGPLARTVPLLLAPEEEAPFSEHLLRVARTLGAARERQEHFVWPGASEAGGVHHAPHGFAWREAAGAPGVRVLRRHSCGDRFALRLALSHHAAGEERLAAVLHHDPRRVEPAAASEVGARLVDLLADAVRDPATRVDRLRLLPRRVRVAVPAAASGADDHAPDVVARFEAWAERAPAQPAVVAEGAILTYAELDAQANQLAHHLRALGVGPEERVALLLERSADAVVAILAVLKAGGAYVPLDVREPPVRLERRLSASGVRVLVTGPEGPRLALPGAARVDVTELRGPLGRLPRTRPAGVAEPASLCYVLFTSGSSGEPKGVGVERRHLAAYVDGVLERLALPPGARFANVTTLAADLGNTAIFVALCGGGTLHLVPDACLMHPAAFGDYVQRHAVDALKIVPGHLRALLAGPAPERALPARVLVLGGEAASWELVDEVRKMAPGCAVLNHYGPTETTVGVCTGRLDGAGPERPASTPPIGHPLRRCRLHLLGPGLEPVAPWEDGEIYVSGAPVARGYLARTGATAERFLPDFLSPEPGARMYRTGDRGRLLGSGEVEFLGRIDRQVKVRGHRVEPGEVEAALREHPGVADSLVVVREDARLGVRLVAYVVPRGEHLPDDAELRGHLAGRLAAASLPAAVVPLQRIPRGPNGKPDPTRLPPERGRAVPTLAPETEAERAIAALWQELLGVEHIGVEDNFFDLGGHSLLMVHLHHQLEVRLGTQVPIVEMFRHPTVRALAQRMGGVRVPEETDSMGEAHGRGARQRASRERLGQRRKESRG